MLCMDTFVWAMGQEALKALRNSIPHCDQLVRPYCWRNNTFCLSDVDQSGSALKTFSSLASLHSQKVPCRLLGEKAIKDLNQVWALKDVILTCQATCVHCNISMKVRPEAATKGGNSCLVLWAGQRSMVWAVTCHSTVWICTTTP